ncbi:hypothetical protein SLA2020_411320 [Shorea laevis]
MELPVSRHLLWMLLLFLSALLSLPCAVKSGDAEALVTLKSGIDVSNSLPWRGGAGVCNWKGVKECMNGRVTKLVLEHLNLTGVLDHNALNQLDQLRVLSFKGNSLSAQIPDLSGLFNLKSLFLNDNNFSGDFPASISSLHRLKVVDLSGNQISGQIPVSLVRLSRLYVLYLQDNRLRGTIPPLNQNGLRFFNVSNNQLSGEIPVTPTLVRFNASSFSVNLNLCGEQLHNPCGSSGFRVSTRNESSQLSGVQVIVVLFEPREVDEDNCREPGRVCGAVGLRVLVMDGLPEAEEAGGGGLEEQGSSGSGHRGREYCDGDWHWQGM